MEIVRRETIWLKEIVTDQIFLIKIADSNHLTLESLGDYSSRFVTIADMKDTFVSVDGPLDGLNNNSIK